MISSLSWCPLGCADPLPSQHELTVEELTYLKEKAAEASASPATFEEDGPTMEVEGKKTDKENEDDDDDEEDEVAKLYGLKDYDTDLGLPMHRRRPAHTAQVPNRSWTLIRIPTSL